MSKERTAISGPLQERIMLILRERPMCGKDLMRELGLKSPGTIYPALDEMNARGLICYRSEVDGAIRRKIYELTEEGKGLLRKSMASSAHMFCCDLSLYVDTVLRDARKVIKISKHQKVLSTLDYIDLESLVNGAELTCLSDPIEGSERFDVILTFTGLGCLIGKKKIDLAGHFGSLRSRLREGGKLFTVEIERTDNLFAKIFFEDIGNIHDQPGMTAKELQKVLTDAGYSKVEITSRSGLLYGVATV
jgi:DNA-binding PadR family transcriptional regulator